jgi:anti-sigma-K factor RskA
MSFGQLVPRSALVAASAAVLLVSGLVAWGYEQRNGSAVIADDPISTLTDESATAYPLDDSDLPVSATGVVFAEPQGREVYLVANGLPALPNDQRYQVWLFTANDQQQSAGLVTVGADGDLRAFLQTPAPFANYVGVALTAEPATGSTVPTSDLVLGGSFPPAIAANLPSAALPSLPA